MPGTLRQAIDSTTPAMLRARGSFKWAAPGPGGFGAAVAEMGMLLRGDSVIDWHRLNLPDEAAARAARQPR